ncbi:MAG: hypothetical protein C4586_08250 [Anaerolineaceae bacterium]|nr:MAG: hypothetical protein C4586_08250 [Anaerolineaceae bacterium]
MPPLFKGPLRPWWFRSALSSTVDPSRATPDALIPDVSASDVVVSGSATSTPYLYICDSGNNRIQVTDYDGNVLFSFGSYGTGDGEFSSPHGVSNDGEHVYVSDTGNHRIQKFTLDGVYVSQWGAYGDGDGEFDFPKGIAADSRFVYVVDHNNHRFQIFDHDGNFIFKFGSFGYGPSTAELNYPTNCAVDSHFLWVEDAGNNRVNWYLLNTMVSGWGYGVLPAMTGDASGSSITPAVGAGVLPALILTSEATGTTGSGGTGAGVLPALSSAGDGSAGAVGVGEGLLPALDSIGTGVSGSIGDGEADLPAITGEADGITGAVGVGNGLLAALIVNAAGSTVRATPEYFGIAVNMRNKAITKYTGFEFNSFSILNDRLYGATSSGVHLVEGDDDDGTAIDAHIKTGTMDIHSPQVQKLVDAWISGRLDGTGVLTIIENEDESDMTGYDVQGDRPNLSDERIPFAKGHKERFVAVKFENTDGADFDITTLTIRTDIVNPKRTR